MPMTREKAKQWRAANSETLRARAKNWRDKNPEKVRAQRKRRREKARWQRLLKTYGITREEYNNMLFVQGGLCALCGEPPEEGKTLCVDHDHDTDVVRSLLCCKCNFALGSFRGDLHLFRLAAHYLEACQ
jgi:hypothetical protein